MKKYIKYMGIGLVCASLFCVVKNCVAYRLPCKSSGMQAAIQEQKIDSIFLGSSLFRQGIDIHTALEETKGNCFVLSYNGNQPVQMREELNMLLEHQVEIENLYVDLYVYSSALRPAISDTRLIWDLDMRGKIDVFSDMVKYSQAGAREFVDFFISANNEYFLFYPVYQLAMKNEFYKGGNIRETHGNTKDVLDYLTTPGDREGIHEVQKQALSDIIAMCKEHEINLIFLEIPKYETLDQADYYQRLRGELEEVVKGQEYIDASQVAFDNGNPKNYQDLFHLSAKGRREYTKQLFDVLNVEERLPQ